MVTWDVEQAELAVVGQFEFLFLYGPRFAGWLSFASISATISSSGQSRREASKAVEAVDVKLKQCDALLARVVVGIEGWSRGSAAAFFFE